MATEGTSRSTLASDAMVLPTKRDITSRRETTAWSVLRAVLMPLASLKLTVALLGAGLFLVFIGTLAQTRYDIWDVVHKYFRTPFSWVEFRVFFPESFFPELAKTNAAGEPLHTFALDLPFGWKLDGFPYLNAIPVVLRQRRLGEEGIPCPRKGRGNVANALRGVVNRIAEWMPQRQR